MLRALIATAAIALLALGACDFGGDGGDDAEPTATADASVPSTPPEEALRLYVQRRLGQDFVEDCEAAERPDDVGKQCARFRGERDGLRAYELGPTFSEYTRLLILQPVGDSWTIARLETRDPNLEPVPGIPWPLQVGANVVVAGTGGGEDCLRVRERPGLQAAIVTCLDEGTHVTIASGTVEVDGFEWWELEGYGWAASYWLRYPEDSTPGPP